MVKVYFKLFFIILAFCLVANCSTRPSGREELQVKGTSGAGITSYEGEVIFDSSKYLHLDIQLQPMSDTEGSFFLTEAVIEDEKETGTLNWKGFYRFHRDAEGPPVLVLENTSREIPLRRTSQRPGGYVREENFRNTDLVFHVFEDHLQLLDQDQIVCPEPKCFFYQRTSPLFTVEGYFMYRGDTTYFYEMNTKIQWPIMKLGAYFQAAREQNTLAQTKHDTTYLKATAYCIRTPAKSREKINALVLRKIIQSSSL
jgi:hypothetical protein